MPFLLDETETNRAEIETIVEESPHDLFGHFREQAKAIWPSGTTIVCPRCQGTRFVSVGEIATHLANPLQSPWPKCCGETMQLGDAPDVLPMAG